MKNVFIILIFLLLALPVSAEEPILFLTNQDEIQTTQFEINDEVYIEGFCLPANQEVGKIYITQDKIWQVGDSLSDISGGIESFTASSDGRVPRTKIWRIPFGEGSYDVVIDTNNDFTLQDYEKQCVLGVTDAGFRVGSQPLPVLAPPPTPPPPSPPPPPPSSSSSSPSKPSTTFSLDEYVEVNNLSNVRKSAGGKIIGTQTEGALGIVVGGPAQASLSGRKFWFWSIDFENDPDGWVSESLLKTAPASALALAPMSIENNATGTNATNTVMEAEEMLAQVSSPAENSGIDLFKNSIIIGIALFFGLVLGSIIIARSSSRKKLGITHSEDCPRDTHSYYHKFMTPKIIGFLQALGVAVYVVVFSVTIQIIQQFFTNKDPNSNPALIIIFFLLAFIISALICGSLVFLCPAILFFEGKKDVAWKIFLWTGIWLALFFIVSALIAVGFVIM